MDKGKDTKKKICPSVNQKPTPFKRAQSLSPIPAVKPKSMDLKPVERRSQSLSNSIKLSKKSLHQVSGIVQPSESSTMHSPICPSNPGQVAEVVLPHNIVTKMMRTLVGKKREFLKMRKHYMAQQNILLEHYALLKDMETRAGVASDDSLDQIRVVTLTNWPPHDLLLIANENISNLRNPEMNSVIGKQVLQQVNAQLNLIPEEVVALGAELMARRLATINLLRNKIRSDRTTYQVNLEWKNKNLELDNETEQLHVYIARTAESMRDKINYALSITKTPWLDRDLLIKKFDNSQKEILILQDKLEEIARKEKIAARDESPPTEGALSIKLLSEELNKERTAREALKEVVGGAESMLRVARARIATLERELRESRNESEAARRKHRELEQLYRHRESNYDARSKKLMEVSKTGEVTIETLSRQRDALEIRVKELRELASALERTKDARELELKSQAEMLKVKVEEQEKLRVASEKRTNELELRIRDLEDHIRNLKEKSMRLVDAQRRMCSDLLPTKENDPSTRETELWKELQVTRVALARAEEELKQSRADKDSFLNSLSRLAQEGVDRIEDKMASELLEREQKVMRLQNIIEEQRENEKLMEQSMTQYENQLAELRLEVKRLRNYDCYSKEVVYQDLQTELLELHMKVATMTRERSSLVSAAASRALMLERHERAAELFARITRLRRELATFVDGRPDETEIDESSLAEVSRSLSMMCASAADTWSALRLERARVLRLERAVLAQRIHLEREERVRTQLERRRAVLEREMIRSSRSSDTSMMNTTSVVSLVCAPNDEELPSF